MHLNELATEALLSLGSSEITCLFAKIARASPLFVGRKACRGRKEQEQGKFPSTSAPLPVAFCLVLVHYTVPFERQNGRRHNQDPVDLQEPEGRDVNPLFRIKNMSSFIIIIIIRRERADLRNRVIRDDPQEVSSKS